MNEKVYTYVTNIINKCTRYLKSYLKMMISLLFNVYPIFSIILLGRTLNGLFNESYAKMFFKYYFLLSFDPILYSVI